MPPDGKPAKCRQKVFFNGSTVLSQVNNDGNGELPGHFLGQIGVGKGIIDKLNGGFAFPFFTFLDRCNECSNISGYKGENTPCGRADDDGPDIVFHGRVGFDYAKFKIQEPKIEKMLWTE